MCSYQQDWQLNSCNDCKLGIEVFSHSIFYIKILVDVKRKWNLQAIIEI